MKKGTGRSHAKVILIGEHSVVYGYAAIALPIKSIPVKVSMLEVSESSNIQSRFFSGLISELPHNMIGIQELIYKLDSDFNQSKTNYSLQIESDVPIGRGLGSSSAIATAIVRCFGQFFNQKMSYDDLLKYINISETIIHGSPSGIDAVTVSSDLPVYFKKGQEPQQILNMNISGYLIIADSGIRGNTGEAVSHVQSEITNNPEKNSYLEDLGKLTEETSELLSTNKVRTMGKVFNQAQIDLKELGVSTPQLDYLIDEANLNGSLGTKITGSGYGGCFIGLTEEYENAKMLSEVLENKGAVRTWIQPLDVYH